MRSLVGELCSEACAGRRPGTPEGAAARAVVVEALRGVGLDPREQPVPGCRGANVIATIPGDIDRWIVVGAHFDHLGRNRGEVYWGADDNAAAVAILVEAARGLERSRPAGRGVVIVAFDGEEPPYFLSGAMGSEQYVITPEVPLDRTDLMICMDLVGRALGADGMPAEVRQTVFALGAERSLGTAAMVDAIASAVPGVVVRRADAEIIPPLSDYFPFWKRQVPFLFLTCGRSQNYHTPRDTPAGLDFVKMAATAQWLERMIRDACARPEPRVGFLEGARDDASTLRSMITITRSLAAFSVEAARGQAFAEALLAACDREGMLPASRRSEVAMLVAMLESGLA